MKKVFKKLLIGASLLLVGCTMPLTSCSLFGEDGFTIVDMKHVNDENGNVVVTFYTTSEETPIITFTVPRGLSGIDGVSIVDVEGKLSDDGNSVTLIFYYSDSSIPPTEVTFPIINGEDGRGIENIDVDKDSDGNLLLTVIYTDGTTQGPLLIPRGIDGEDGNGILKIEPDYLSDPNNVIITIYFTDGTNTTFKVAKGIGINSISYDEETSTDDIYSLKIVYSDGYVSYIEIPRPKTSEWFTGEDAPDSTLGKDGDFYLNIVNGFVYQKKNGSWNYLLCMKGTGSAVNFLVKFYPSEGTWSDGSDDTIAMVIDYGEYIDLDKIPTPVRENYVFNGWWTTQDSNPNAGHFTDLTPVLKDMNLYPRWIEA